MIARRKKSLSLIELYKEFLRHTSMCLPADRQLTFMQIEILATFWNFTGELAERDRFGPSARSIVKDMFKFKNYSNLNNQLIHLKNKKWIYENSNGSYSIVPLYDLPKDIKNLVLEYTFDVIDR